MEGSECDRFNQKILKQSVSLADRVRSMTDEELAVWLARMRYGIAKSIFNQLGKDIPSNSEKLLQSSNNVLQALQAPFERGK